MPFELKLTNLLIKTLKRPLKNLFFSGSVKVLIILLIFIFACQEKSRVSEEQLLRNSYTSQLDGLERDYFLYLPKGYGDDPARKWPVMLFLHGNGERGNGKEHLDFNLAHGPLFEAWVQRRDLPFIIIAPQLHLHGFDTIQKWMANRDLSQYPKRLDTGTPNRAPKFPSKISMEGAMSSPEYPYTAFGPMRGWETVEHDLMDMLDQTLENYATDKSRVYLTGLSYGGFGTWYMASKHPERFAAIAPIVGWGHVDLMQPIAHYQLPVWCYAGGRDEVIEAKYFYPGINRLEALGHKDVRFTIEVDMAHDVWTRVYAGEDIYQWLLQYSLEP